MKFVLLALFAIGISCSSACSVPIGCGTVLNDVCNAVKPYVNVVGAQIIDKLNAEILDLRDAIELCDIQTLSNLFANVGSPGYRNLATTTSDCCLQEVFLELSNFEAFVASQLQGTLDPNVAAEIVCSALNYEAQQISGCSCINAPAAYLIN